MSVKIIIVGAGLSGISAAISLAKDCISSTIIDESPRAGGAVYRGVWRKTLTQSNLFTEKNSMFEELSKYSSFISIKSNAKVIGQQGVNELIISCTDEYKISIIKYDKLVIATGCYERSIPFPGWQIPGVMLLGGIQLQLKSGLIKPGNSIVLVGSGPLLLLAAYQLHRVGCNVIGIYELASFTTIASSVLSLLRCTKLFFKGISLLTYLIKNNIRIHYGWGILEARGEKQLNEVVVAPYSKAGKPIKSKMNTLLADTLGVGYGFVSRSQLAQLLGLDMKYDFIHGVYPIVDKFQRSSKNNVFCVGDCTQVIGGDAAIIEGKIAALRIAYELNKLSKIDMDKAFLKFSKTLLNYKAFNKELNKGAIRRLNMLNLPEHDTLICRCEGIKKSVIDTAIKNGCQDITTLKMRSRIAMGDCQGKVCSHYCYDRLLSEGYPVNEILISPRFPLDTIPFSYLED